MLTFASLGSKLGRMVNVWGHIKDISGNSGTNIGKKTCCKEGPLGCIHLLTKCYVGWSKVTMEGWTPSRPDGRFGPATCKPLVLDTGCNYGRIYVDLWPVLCLACQQLGLLHLGHLQQQNRTSSMLQLGPTKCVNSVMFWNLIPGLPTHTQWTCDTHNLSFSHTKLHLSHTN